MSKIIAKTLIIVESPTKAKTISKFLKDQYIIESSYGHVRDLPKSNKKAIDIEGGFIPHYEISKGKELVVAKIKNLAKTAKEVLLATDPDREGEAIAWHLADALGIGIPNPAPEQSSVLDQSRTETKFLVRGIFPGMN